MADDLERRALVLRIERRLQALPFDALRTIERCIGAIEDYDPRNPLDELTLALFNVRLDLDAEDRSAAAQHELERDEVVPPLDPTDTDQPIAVHVPGGEVG